MLLKSGFHRGMSIEMDAREVGLKLAKFDRNVLNRLRSGIGLALLALMDDIVEEAPTAPILTSALRGSMTAFVNKTLIGTSKKYQTGGENYRQLKNSEPNWNKGEQGLLAVNAPYATLQHERFENKSETGAGMFFVMKKITRFAKKYGQIVVREMKRTKI